MRCLILVMLFACGIDLKLGKIVQSPLGERLPCKICFPLYIMIAACLSKCAVQTLSHNLLMEMREFWSFGKIFAVVALVGRMLEVMSKFAV